MGNCCTCTHISDYEGELDMIDFARELFYDREGISYTNCEPWCPEHVELCSPPN